MATFEALDYDLRRHVADRLGSAQTAIVDAWAAAVRADPRIQTDRSLSYADFIDHIPNVLREICDRLKGAVPDAEMAKVRREAHTHGVLRWKQGYDLTEMLLETGHLRQVLVDFVATTHGDLQLTPDQLAGLASMIAEIVDEGLVTTVVSYVEERDREASDQRGELSRRDAALQDAGVRLQEALLQQERRRVEALEAAARAKDEFLATLSHELRTPLTPILAWITVLERTQVPPPVQKAVATIGRNARVLGQLINDLLDVSRIITEKLDISREPLDARAFVRAARDTVQPEADLRDVRLVLNEPSAPVPLLGDPIRLQQVVWNLLSNAVKFSGPSSEVTIDVQTDDAAVRVAVTDRGQGIDRTFLPHLFERFSQQDQRSTRGHGGLGLGLAIARAIAEAHGGRLTAASEGRGRGARFELELPMEEPPPPAA